MNICHCAIPAMGGSCVGCSNYVQSSPVWDADFSAPLGLTRFPQPMSAPALQQESIEQKLDKIILLLQKRAGENNE